MHVDGVLSKTIDCDSLAHFHVVKVRSKNLDNLRHMYSLIEPYCYLARVQNLLPIPT
jgi:hypothetical protein